MPKKVSYVNKGLTKTQKQQVNALVKHRIIKESEPKRHFVNVSTTLSDTPFYIFHLNDIDTGDTQILRDGDQIYAKKLHFRFNAILGDTTNIVRLLFFWADVDATPSDADILHFAANGVINCISPISILEPNIKIIRDYMFNVSTDGQVSRHITIPLHNKVCTYIDATGSNLGRGMLYVCALSDSTAVSHVTFNYTSDFVFSDK